jgi:hypothetical protein
VTVVTSSDRTGQDRRIWAEQDKTRQDRTGQDRRAGFRAEGRYIRRVDEIRQTQ